MDGDIDGDTYGVQPWGQPWGQWWGHGWGPPMEWRDAKNGALRAIKSMGLNEHLIMLGFLGRKLSSKMDLEGTQNGAKMNQRWT